MLSKNNLAYVSPYQKYMQDFYLNVHYSSLRTPPANAPTLDLRASHAFESPFYGLNSNNSPQIRAPTPLEFTY
jgi:hypothetical protein